MLIAPEVGVLLRPPKMAVNFTISQGVYSTPKRASSIIKTIKMTNFGPRTAHTYFLILDVQYSAHKVTTQFKKIGNSQAVSGVLI